MRQISFKDDILPLKDLLYRLALRITRGSGDAEDIVQETLIRVWKSRDRWQEIDSIEAFSLTICRNLSLDWLRKHGQHEQASSSEAATVPDSRSPGPLESTLIADRVEQVRRIIDSLPEKQRSCIQLRDFEGKTYKEVATALQISEEQVKVSIFRARQAIKNQFTKIDSYGL